MYVLTLNTLALLFVDSNNSNTLNESNPPGTLTNSQKKFFWKNCFRGDIQILRSKNSTLRSMNK